MTAVYLSEYGSIVIYTLLSAVLAVILFGLSYTIARHKGDVEKVSGYECGFDPFDDARHTFHVRFFLVAILFIIFDLEITFLFPWCLVLGQIPMFAFWSMMVFLGILTVGFLYEWQKGALEWE